MKSGVSCNRLLFGSALLLTSSLCSLVNAQTITGNVGSTGADGTPFDIQYSTVPDLTNLQPYINALNGGTGGAGQSVTYNNDAADPGSVLTITGGNGGAGGSAAHGLYVEQSLNITPYQGNPGLAGTGGNANGGLTVITPAGNGPTTVSVTANGGQGNPSPNTSNADPSTYSPGGNATSLAGVSLTGNYAANVDATSTAGYKDGNAAATANATTGGDAQVNATSVSNFAGNSTAAATAIGGSGSLSTNATATGDNANITATSIANGGGSISSVATANAGINVPAALDTRAIATGVSSGNAPVNVSATANGGLFYSLAPTTASLSASANGQSNGGDVSVSATENGGSVPTAGSTQSNALIAFIGDPIYAASVAMNNAVSGSTTGNLTLNQSAIAGNNSDVPFSSPGDASSIITLIDNQAASVSANVSASSFANATASVSLITSAGDANTTATVLHGHGTSYASSVSSGAHNATALSTGGGQSDSTATAYAATGNGIASATANLNGAFGSPTVSITNAVSGQTSGALILEQSAIGSDGTVQSATSSLTYSDASATSLTGVVAASSSSTNLATLITPSNSGNTQGGGNTQFVGNTPVGTNPEGNPSTNDRGSGIAKGVSPADPNAIILDPNSLRYSPLTGPTPTPFSDNAGSATAVVSLTSTNPEAPVTALAVASATGGLASNTAPSLGSATATADAYGLGQSAALALAQNNTLGTNSVATANATGGASIAGAIAVTGSGYAKGGGIMNVSASALGTYSVLSTNLSAQAITNNGGGIQPFYSISNANVVAFASGNPSPSFVSGAETGNPFLAPAFLSSVTNVFGTGLLSTRYASGNYGTGSFLASVSFEVDAHYLGLGGDLYLGLINAGWQFGAGDTAHLWATTAFSGVTDVYTYTVNLAFTSLTAGDYLALDFLLGDPPSNGGPTGLDLNLNNSNINDLLGNQPLFDLGPAVVPEPASLGMFGVGLIGGIGTRLRRRVKRRRRCSAAA